MHAPGSASPLSLRFLFQLADGLSGAIIGFVFYGGWAIWANAGHGLDIALRAGWLQGGMSFIVTLSGTSLMKAFYGRQGRPLWRAVRAAAGALALIYGLIVSTHLLNGTPEILLTLAPGIPITIAFCISFSAGLMHYGNPQQRATP